MREIKFRAWIKEEQIITYFEDESYILNGDMSVDAFDYDKSDCKNYFEPCYKTVDAEIMQYIGLKDKNGKEIYEGDIVKKLIWNELKFEAEGDGQEYCYAKVMYIEELAGFYLVNRDNKILWEVSQDKYNIEVAGNIYDNPELLKGEQS